MIYTHRFTVVGGIEFPIDMLRYDRCTPTGPDDSSAIIASLRVPHLEQIIVNLQTENTNKSWVPTRDRWRSFGWEIKGPVVRGKSNDT